jgi:hypothetical protein
MYPQTARREIPMPQRRNFLPNMPEPRAKERGMDLLPAILSKMKAARMVWVILLHVSAQLMGVSTPDMVFAHDIIAQAEGGEDIGKSPANDEAAANGFVWDGFNPSGYGRYAYSDADVENAFRNYFDALPFARQGAKLVNELAFGIYKNIADDGEGTFYFSPYGLYDSLWEFCATSPNAGENGIYSDDARPLFEGLKKVTLDHFANMPSKRQLYEFSLASEDKFFSVFDAHLLHPANVRSMLGALMDKFIIGAGSSFSVANAVSITAGYDDLKDIAESVSLSNSTSLSLNLLDAGVVSLNQGAWHSTYTYAGVTMHYEGDGIESMRVKFKTRKHSLLTINPKERSDLKTIERDMTVEKVEGLIKKMEPKAKIAFRFVSPFFKGNKAAGLDLKRTGILKGTGLAHYAHTAAFDISSLGGAGGVGVWINHTNQFRGLKPETLADEHHFQLMPFDRPFLFFVIDDITGAILIMGRSSGYQQDKAAEE